MIQKIKRTDIKKIDFYVVPRNGRQTIYQVFDKFKPDFIINGSMYSTKTGETCADAIDETVLVGGGNWSDKGTAIFGDKDIRWMSTYEARKQKSRDFIGSAPTLIIDGKVSLDKKGLNNSFVNDKKIRSYFAWNSNDILIGCTGSPKSCQVVANELLSSGAVFASNLDGGGSSVIGKKEGGKLKLINKPTETRPNANWILIYLNENHATAENPTESSKIACLINGNQQSVTGFIEDGRTYIQIRELGEITGAYSLDYDRIPVISSKPPKPPKPTMPGKGKLELLINGHLAYIDGDIREGRTYLQIKDFGFVTGLFTIGYNRIPIIDIVR